MPPPLPARNEMEPDRGAEAFARHIDVAPGIRPRRPHGELYLSGERDGQASHPRLRYGGETLFIPEPGEAEHEEE